MMDYKKDSLETNFHAPRNKVVLNTQEEKIHKQILKKRLSKKQGKKANTLQHLKKGGFGPAEGKTSSFYIGTALKNKELIPREESAEFEFVHPMDRSDSSKSMKTSMKHKRKKRKI